MQLDRDFLIQILIVIDIFRIHIYFLQNLKAIVGARRMLQKLFLRRPFVISLSPGQVLEPLLIRDMGVRFLRSFIQRIVSK